MAHEFQLPDIGEGLVDAVIVSWHVRVGEEIGLDQPLVEVETDKAIVDIPSPFEGVVLHRGGENGDTIEVGALLVVIGEAHERWQPEAPRARTGPVSQAMPIVGALPGAPSGTTFSRPQALPFVRRLAEESGVDLSAISGTGPEGRITEQDVRAAARSRPTRRVPMSRLRKTIADNLARSWREIPHVTTYGYADADAVLTAREQIGRPPLEAILISRLVPLLAHFPAFNSSCEDDAIVERRFYDIGFAVDTDDGLMVPVIRDADTRSMDDLATEIQRLANGARNRTLRVDELRGQTFTVSNIGAVGGGHGTPIIPYGTSAILSVGRAELRPVVRDGAVVVGREFPLSLSYDHRIIDGATGRRFMAAFIEALQT